MRRARNGPLAHDVQRALRLPEPAHRMVDAPAAEALLRQHEPVARRTDQMVVRHPAVGEDDLRVVAGASVLGLGMGHRADVPHHVHARRSLGNDEDRRVLVRPALGVGLGEDQRDVSRRGVGGEPLVAVDDPLFAVAHGRRLDDGRIGTGNERLGQRERTGDVTAQVGPEPALFLLVGGAVGEQLHVAAVGGLHAEDDHRVHAAADDLRHLRELQLTEARPAQLGVEEGAPQSPELSPDPAGAA